MSWGATALCVLAFGKGPSRVARGPKSAASHFEWAAMDKGPDSSDGGLPLPFTGDGLRRFDPPSVFAACTAVTQGGARDVSASGPRMIIMTLHVTWGHASAHQLKRVWVDPANGNSHPVPYVDEVLRRCGSCRASDKAPRAPIAGAPAAPMFNEKVQADILFSRALIALRSMYMFPKYSLLHPSASEWVRGGIEA